MEKGLVEIWETPSYKELFESANLRISPRRAFVLIEFLRHTMALEGDVAELGVYKGSSAYILASLLEHTQKRLYLFDTFEGTPKHSSKDNVKREGLYSDTSLEGVKEYLQKFANMELHKGFIPQSLSVLEGKKLSFCHIHLNLYSSTKDALESIFELLCKGGILFIEDYGLEACAGVKSASDEFAKSKNIHTIWLPTGQGIIIK